MHQLIRSLNESVRKVHGQDMCILVARAVAFGHDDNLFLVQGERHEAAAGDVAGVVSRSLGKKARIGEAKGRDFDGSEYAYSTVAF